MSSGRAIAIHRLRHMLAATDSIAVYTARRRDAFDRDFVVRDAILYRVIVLGEAAKAVVTADPALARELTGVEWSLLAKMRDRLTHQHWETDSDVVRSTATRDVP